MHLVQSFSVFMNKSTQQSSIGNLYRLTFTFSKTAILWTDPNWIEKKIGEGTYMKYTWKHDHMHQYSPGRMPQEFLQNKWWEVGHFGKHMEKRIPDPQTCFATPRFDYVRGNVQTPIPNHFFNIGVNQSTNREENRCINAPIYDRMWNYADNTIQRNNFGHKGFMNPKKRDNVENEVIMKGINEDQGYTDEQLGHIGKLCCDAAWHKYFEGNNALPILFMPDKVNEDTGILPVLHCPLLLPTGSNV